jgi:predicted ATPase/class 3 adenylate cyclase
MTGLPSGTVTFLFTDLEGSTRLWEEHPDAMPAALARHDEVLRAAIDAHDGQVVKTTGDGVHAVFASVRDALGAAVGAQCALGAEAWGKTGPLRVRMGLHTGEGEQRGGDYYGSALNRAARIMNAGHGGQIVVSQATEVLVRDASSSDAVTLVDLGEHRLRDLSRAEQLFQVAHPELIRDFPALRSLDAFAGNLPVQLTSFVGRADDVAGVAKALTESRLVTLTGVGGVGKTRLALQVAAEVLPRFADGAWVCELAAASGPEAMVQVVAASLGVSPRPGLSLEGSIREFLAPKTLLVVLDNCEHLLDAAGRLAEGVLRDCREVRILATSREGLSVAGEQVSPLRSLPLPDQTALLDSDATRLFVERAFAVRPEFAPEANEQAVAEICRRLDGVPLAIELAAARVAVMGPVDIASRLDERFRLLTGGRRTAVERHQTLRATVDWSYSLLSPTERAVFDRLSVFAGSFDADAAETVAAGEGIESWDVLEALGSLVTKSMIVLEDTVDGGVRYLLLETLRQYARERLAEDADPEIWRRRHAQYYLQFSEAAVPNFPGPEELAWQGRLRAELDNLRAAVFWGLGRSGPDAQLGLHIIASLTELGEGDPSVGVHEWAEAALDQVDRAEPPIRTAVLASAAAYAGDRGDTALSEARALDALRDGLPSGTPHPSLAHFTLAFAFLGRGDVHRALEIVAEGHAALDAIASDDDSNGIRFGHVILHYPSSYAYAVLGDERRGRANADEMLRLARASRQPTAIGAALVTDAFWSWRDDREGTLGRLEESTALLRQMGDARAGQAALALRGQVEVVGGHRQQGLETLREAVVVARDSGIRMGLIVAVDRLVQLGERLGDPHVTAVLGGVVTGSPLGTMSMVAPRDREERARALEQVRATLTPDEYEAAFARGAAMSYEEVVAYTLGELDRLIAEVGHG